jgi:N-hydroxyarylamine O-acetyltransferase
VSAAKATIDVDTRDRLLRRIGIGAVPPADATGLAAIQRAFVASVPFEDLTVQLGESAPLDPPALVERVLGGGRGGYCFEVNTVLRELLTALGFEVTRHQAIVGARDAHGRGEPTNHLALVVDTPEAGRFIAEGGWGEGPMEPLPLAEGRAGRAPFEVTIERDGDGWWVAQHEFGSSPGFRFADEPATLADFEPHHARLSGTADSPFAQTLLVQRPGDERIDTLRSRSVFADGPGLRERRLLADRDEFVAALRGFGIDTWALGPARRERLWERAVAQHNEHEGAERVARAET